MGLSIQPYGNVVAIARFEAPEFTRGIIVRVDRPERGVVLAVGDGITREDGTLDQPEVSVGDIVAYKHRKGTEVTVDGMIVTLVRGEDLRYREQEEAA